MAAAIFTIATVSFLCIVESIAFLVWSLKRKKYYLGVPLSGFSFIFGAYALVGLALGVIGDTEIMVSLAISLFVIVIMNFLVIRESAFRKTGEFFTFFFKKLILWFVSLGLIILIGFVFFNV